MIKFKEFLKECLLNERNDFAKEYRQSNDYRHSIGLPDEDKIPENAIWLGQIAVEEPKKNQGIQSSVEDEARRRIMIEDDLMTPVEPPRDTDPFIRQHKLNQKILNTLADIESRKPDSRGLVPSTQTVNFRRLQSTMDNIVNDRKAQFPDLAKEQEELSKAREKLKQKRGVIDNVIDLLPHSVATPKGPAKITNYFKNLLDTESSKISDDVSDNTKKQDQMPFSMEYGRFENAYGIPVIPQYKPEFEQTRTFTADPALALPQENKQGIRLGRVDYSRKNK